MKRVLRSQNRQSPVRIQSIFLFHRYGYVDPDGQIREFTYESGIPCDPLTKEPLAQPSQPQQQQQQAAQQAQADPRITTGYYDYNQNKFVLPNGKRVTVLVNDNNRARGKRSL